MSRKSRGSLYCLVGRPKMDMKFGKIYPAIGLGAGLHRQPNIERNGEQIQ